MSICLSLLTCNFAFTGLNASIWITSHNLLNKFINSIIIHVLKKNLLKTQKLNLSSQSKQNLWVSDGISMALNFTWNDSKWTKKNLHRIAHAFYIKSLKNTDCFVGSEDLVIKNYYYQTAQIVLYLRLWYSRQAVP